MRQSLTTSRMALVLISSVVVLVSLSAWPVAGQRSEVRYYKSSEDPGSGTRVVGCCEYYDQDEDYHYLTRGVCHKLDKETWDCAMCCGELGKEEKFDYRWWEWNCKCVAKDRYYGR